MPPPVIRPAVEADLTAVRACLVDTWHATYDALYGLDEVTRLTNSWHAIPVLRSQLADRANIFLVAECNDVIAATALLQLSDPGLAKLLRLYVSPAHQGQTIGAKLLTASLCTVPVGTRIRLEVARANRRAIAFYERRGFSQIRANEAGETLVYELTPA
jgi:ribosomal protein S18 acetylase RimI-like enzyme